MDLSPTIKAVQRKLGLDDDGVAGPLTWAAISTALGIERQAEIAQALNLPEARSDSRSEENIETLNPAVQSLFRKFILLLNERGLDAKIISGFRTYEQQSVLYDKYKRGGPQAAPPGFSNHNFGFAVDIGLFENGKYLEESPLYRKAGEIGKELGLIWGGDWSNSDDPHFEFRPSWAKDFSENQALAEYRERLKKGVALT